MGSRPRLNELPVRAFAISIVLASLATARSALACSDFEEILALPGAHAQFESDGDAVWLFDGEGTWVRLALTGEVRRLPSPSRLSWLTEDGSALLEVRDGPFRSDCSFDWQRVDRLDLVSGVRTASPRLQGPYPWVLSASPRGTRALVQREGEEGTEIFSVDVERRRMGRRVESLGPSVFLDESRVASLEEGVLRVVDLDTGAERSRVAVPIEHPDALVILRSDAGPAGVTLLDGSEEEWTLVRVDLSREPPAVSRSLWTGHGAMGGMSRDGTRVVLRSLDHVTVLDRASGRPIAEVGGPPFLVAAALGPDGSLLAVASRGGPPAEPSSDGVEVWPDESRPVGPVVLEVFDLADGRRLASYGDAVTPRSQVTLVEP